MRKPQGEMLNSLLWCNRVPALFGHLESFDRIELRLLVKHTNANNYLIPVINSIRDFYVLYI